jgi:hypothetical protein
MNWKFPAASVTPPWMKVQFTPPLIERCRSCRCFRFCGGAVRCMRQVTGFGGIDVDLRAGKNVSARLLDSKCPRAGRLAVEKRLDGVFPLRRTTRTLEVECSGRDVPVGHMLLWLPKDTSRVHPADADGAGPDAGSEHGYVHGIARLEAGRVAGDGPVCIQRSPELNQVTLKPAPDPQPNKHANRTISDNCAWNMLIDDRDCISCLEARTARADAQRPRTRYHTVAIGGRIFGSNEEGRARRPPFLHKKIARRDYITDDRS